MLVAFLRVLFLCETRGVWPTKTTLVIIVLLPKSDGGRRPIGLFSLLTRVWMRIRRTVANAWETANDRDFSSLVPGAEPTLEPS